MVHHNPLTNRGCGHSDGEEDDFRPDVAAFSGVDDDDEDPRPNPTSSASSEETETQDDPLEEDLLDTPDTSTKGERLPSLTAYLARKMADAVAKRLGGKLGTEEREFKEKHMRGLMRLIMQEMMASKGKTPDVGHPPSVKTYLDTLQRTANQKLVKWLSNSSTKWTSQASIVIQGLKEVERTGTEREKILADLYTENTSQKHQITGFNARFALMEGKIAEMAKELTATRKIQKKDPPGPQPRMDTLDVSNSDIEDVVGDIAEWVIKVSEFRLEE